MHKLVSLAALSISICLGPACALAEPHRVDERRAGELGIRRVDGRHLRLYTDLPPGDAVDGLGNVFDAAVDEWADYFGVPPEEVSRWRMQGFLIQDRAKFAALGLMPEAQPDFEHGYCQGAELWVVDQPSDYYRRHLLLHEGTHGFMYAFLGEDWPGWYLEGMAELLGTHRWNDGKLTLRELPAKRDDFPMWGRIKLIKDSQPMPLPAVIQLGEGRLLTTDEYAWVWALCKFLDSHPRWQERFRKLTARERLADFDPRFRSAFRDDWDDLLFEWQAFVAALDFGYDAQRMAIAPVPATAVAPGAEVTIAADRGWQSTGWLLKEGQTYKISAAGRYVIARDDQPWPCEPGGVTIEYHDGRPLGKLLGVLRPVEDKRPVDFAQPIAIGLGNEVTPEVDAVLYVRVNDSPGHLSDNAGTLKLSVD